MWVMANEGEQRRNGLAVGQLRDRARDWLDVGSSGLLTAGPAWLKPATEAAVDESLAMIGQARALTKPSSRWQPPAFVIVGGQRCGTTSMYRYLTAHPQVAAALSKEVHFFDVNYGRGPDWYAAHFVTRRRAEVRSRRLGRQIVTGEASPYYMFHPHAVQRLQLLVPEAKIIVMLRDPVQRAISHYTHERAKGFETADFLAALRLEDSRLAGEEGMMHDDPTYRSFSHQHFSYVGRGKYLGQLQRIYQFFPPEQVFIVSSNEFYQAPNRLYRQLVGFLGLEDHTLPTYKRYNTYSSVKPDETTRGRLVRTFAASNAALYDFLGKDLGWSR